MTKRDPKMWSTVPGPRRDAVIPGRRPSSAQLGNTQLLSEARAIPPGDGTNLTDRQRMVLARLSAQHRHGKFSFPRRGTGCLHAAIPCCSACPVMLILSRVCYYASAVTRMLFTLLLLQLVPCGSCYYADAIAAHTVRLALLRLMLLLLRFCSSSLLSHSYSLTVLLSHSYRCVVIWPSQAILHLTYSQFLD
jgi:hypothetical protein